MRLQTLIKPVYAHPKLDQLGLISSEVEDEGGSGASSADWRHIVKVILNKHRMDPQTNDYVSSVIQADAAPVWTNGRNTSPLQVFLYLAQPFCRYIQDTASQKSR